MKRRVCVHMCRFGAFRGERHSPFNRSQWPRTLSGSLPDCPDLGIGWAPGSLPTCPGLGIGWAPRPPFPAAHCRCLCRSRHRLEPPGAKNLRPRSSPPGCAPKPLSREAPSPCRGPRVSEPRTPQISDLRASVWPSTWGQLCPTSLLGGLVHLQDE